MFTNAKDFADMLKKQFPNDVDLIDECYTKILLPISNDQEPEDLPDSLGEPPIPFFKDEPTLADIENFFLGSRPNIVSFYMWEFVTQHWMWAYVSRPFLDAFATYLEGKTVLDPFAGRGWLARGLRERGIHVIATDLHPWPDEASLTEIFPMDALEAIQTYGPTVDTIILSWVPINDPIDVAIVKENRHNSLLHKELIWMGENGGTSGSAGFSKIIKYPETSAAFHAVASKYQTWNGMKDHMYVIE